MGGEVKKWRMVTSGFQVTDAGFRWPASRAPPAATADRMHARVWNTGSRGDVALPPPRAASGEPQRGRPTDGEEPRRLITVGDRAAAARINGVGAEAESARARGPAGWSCSAAASRAAL